MDGSSGVVDRSALDRLVEKCGFADFYPTSALSGYGIKELKKAIADTSAWVPLTVTSRWEVFQRIRDEIGRRQEKGEVILPLRTLEDFIRRAYPDSFEPSVVAGEAERLEQQGVIATTQLASGERMLVLKIDEVERYAGSLILKARNNPRGVPALEERTLASPSSSWPGIKEKERLQYYPEIAVLECVVELLIQHGICFRHGGLLIFPTLFPDIEADSKERMSHSVSLYYDFTGAIDNIYASLVARLVVGGGFGKHRLWANRIEFDEPGKGVCGIRKVEREGGLARIDLFFGEDTEEQRRHFFISFVEDHLRRHDVHLGEHLVVKCRGCGHEISEDIVQENIARGQKDVVCPYCRPPTITSISEGIEMIRERDRESGMGMVAIRTDMLRKEGEDRTNKDAQEVKKAVSRKANQQRTRTEKPILILHLSDLHFTRETSPETKLQWLVDDLQEERFLDFDGLDYLVISGDMTDRGQEEGLENARQFVSSLIREFGLSSARCILVPGNHDLQDRNDSYEWHMNVDGLERRKWVKEGNIYLARNEDKYALRLEKFSNAFFHKVTDQPYPLHYKEQGLAYLFEDTRIQFLALNSCWEIDQFNRKRSGIHPDSVAHVIRNAKKQVKEAVDRGDMKKGERVLRLAVWHHAAAGPEMIQDTSFIENLQNNGVKVCLHGDIHEMRRELVGYWHHKKAHIVGAGSFGSPAEGRPGSMPRLYNLLEVRRDLSSIRVHTREQRKPDGSWEGWYQWPADNRAHRVPYYDIELNY